VSTDGAIFRLLSYCLQFLRRRLKLPSEDSHNAALSLLAGLSDDRIESMCEIMSDMS